MGLIVLSGSILVDTDLSFAQGTTTWTGGVSTDWEDASNWDNGVPGSSDHAVINNATFDPVPNVAASVNDLTINAVGFLIVNGQSLVINGNLLVTITNNPGDGFITTNAADNVTFTHVNNNDIATSVGNFTDGVLKFRGHFTQTTGSNSGTRPIFSSTGTRVVFDGSNNQNIHFSDTCSGFSRFQDLDIDNTAGVTFTTSAAANGTVTILNGNVTSTTGTVTIGDDLIDVDGGRWQALNTTFSGANVSLPATLTTHATFTGGGLLENGFDLTGNLSVAASGKMEVNSHIVSTSGDLTVTITNTVGDGLIMTNASDEVIINCVCL
jgi:hypothetical protein